MKPQKTALIAAMVAGLALSGITLADQGSGPGKGPQPDRPMHDGPGPHHGMDPGDPGGKGMARMADKLNLTEEQKTKLKEIRLQAAEDSKPLREEMRKNMEAERKAFDEGAGKRELKKLAEKSADTRVELMLQSRTVEEKINGVLTDEQKAQLEAMKAQREAHREERMKEWQKK